MNMDTAREEKVGRMGKYFHVCTLSAVVHLAGEKISMLWGADLMLCVMMQSGIERREEAERYIMADLGSSLS